MAQRSPPPPKRKEPSLRDLGKLPPSDDELGETWAEIERQSHRASAVLAGALVEAALQFALYTHFVFLSKLEMEGLFDYPAPLASFDAKIRIAYAIGLYGPVVRHDLDIVRKVRNGFAHAQRPLTFETPQIAREVAKGRYLPLIRDELPQLVADRIQHHDSHYRTAYATLAFVLSHKLFVLGLPLGKRLKIVPSLP
jgi:hypothetical protein